MSILDKTGLTGFTNDGPFGGENPGFATTADMNAHLPGAEKDLKYLHSAFRACIDRIIARALPAEYEAENDKVTQKLENPQGRGTRITFFRQLLEQLLLTGNALVYSMPDGRHYVAITSGSSYDPVRKIWNLRTSYYQQGGNHALLQKWAYNERECVHIYLGYKEGNDPYLVQSPIRSVVEAMKLHEATRSVLNDYATSGFKVMGAVGGRDNMVPKDPAKFVENLEDVKSDIKSSPQNFQIIGHPAEAQFYSAFGNIPQPDGAGIEIALQEIARVYGVPMEMIQARKERTDYTNVDDHLMSDAVYPVLDMVCAGLSRHFNTIVKVKPLTAMRAVMGAYAKNLTAMSQTDAFTRNEVRQAAGQPPLPPGKGGDELPQAAGAGYAPDKKSENGRPVKVAGQTPSKTGNRT